MANADLKKKEYLNKKFGNEVKEVKLESIKTIALQNAIKTFGFYKIFDLGNNLNDEKLIEYRNEVKIKKEYD